MNQPLISIIIPTYNRAELIGETLDSVITQTYQNWECIIVDDGSTDNTAEVVNHYIIRDSRFQLHNRPKDRLKGGNAARNYGFEISNGEYIQWFDSDDLMHSELLAKKIDALIQSPEFDYCLCRMAAFFINEGEFVIKKVNNINSENLFMDYLKGKIVIGTPTVLWRKSVIETCSKFDENLNQSQDLEFNSRMFHKNKKVSFVDEVLIFYRSSENSISTNFYPQIEMYLESFLEVRRRILFYDIRNIEFTDIVNKSVLGVFRHCLAGRKYDLCETIIVFLRKYNKRAETRLKLERIFFFYHLFKVLGRGDTKFKFLLKL